MTDTIQNTEMKKLTEQYPVEDIFEGSLDNWKKTDDHAAPFIQSFTSYATIQCFRGSVIQNFEIENLYARIAKNAAEQGGWVGIKYGQWTPEMLEAFNRDRKNDVIDDPRGQALSKSIDLGLIKIDNIDGEIYFLPTEESTKQARYKVQRV